MPRFSIRNPYFIIVVSLVLAVIGVTSLVRMPVEGHRSSEEFAGRASARGPGPAGLTTS